MIKNQLIRASFAEFVATALFVWIGCGSALATNSWGTSGPSGGDLLAIATAFGFAIALLAYSIGHISGGHINPAVSFALYLLGEVDMKTMLFYIMAQLIGAVMGALLLWGCVTSLDSDKPIYKLGVNGLAPGVGLGSGFLIELMGTFLLVFTVCMTAVHKKSGAGNAAPIAIGWSVMMAHIVMIPFTGCGINPARSFGPMLVNSFAGVNTWSTGWWIFYSAPFVGAGLAAMTYKCAFAECDDEEGEEKETENLLKETDPEAETAATDDAKNAGDVEANKPA